MGLFDIDCMIGLVTLTDNAICCIAAVLTISRILR